MFDVSQLTRDPRRMPRVCELQSPGYARLDARASLCSVPRVRNAREAEVAVT